jgi:acyl-CoA synthetase (AMP-forming)/AMP-acid ligase II
MPPSTLLRDLLIRAAELYPAHPAVVCGTRNLTWSQLRDRSFQLAGRLQDEGVKRGSRVAALQANELETSEIAWALAELGAVMVPMSARLAAAEVAFIVGDAGADLALVSSGLEDRLDGTPTRVIVSGGGDYEAYLAQATPTEPAELESDSDIALQLYTSGTTGRPKGVLLSQRSSIQNALTTLAAQQLRHEDVFMTATPLTHAAGGTRIFTLAIDGLTHVVVPKFDPGDWFRIVARERVTATILIAPMMRAIIEHPDLAGADVSSLRLIVYGAAPTPVELLEAAMQKLPTVGFFGAYGLTEGHPQLTVLTPEEHHRFAADPTLRRRLGSIGRAGPGVRIWPADSEGRRLPPGEPGELMVRSTKSMDGYWNNPAATEEAFRDGWLATGDVGYLDDDGYIFLVDRKKEMLISGGFNVYPSEIERAMRAHEGVREVAVVGIPDASWGEVPVAFVVAQPGRTVEEAELRAICERELARYKHPREIHMIEALPRNETGKILKQELKRLAQSRSEEVPR